MGNNRGGNSPGKDRKKNAPAERSADYDAMLAQYCRAQEIAREWAASIRMRNTRKVDRLLKEMLKTAAFDFLARLNQSDNRTTSGEIALLARIVKDLVSADKIKVELEAKIRQMKAETARKTTAAAGEVAAIGRSGGLSSEAEQRMREILEGIAS